MANIVVVSTTDFMNDFIQRTKLHSIHFIGKCGIWLIETSRTSLTNEIHENIVPFGAVRHFHRPTFNLTNCCRPSHPVYCQCSTLSLIVIKMCVCLNNYATFKVYLKKVMKIVANRNGLIEHERRLQSFRTTQRRKRLDLNSFLI